MLVLHFIPLWWYLVKSNTGSDLSKFKGAKTRLNNMCKRIALWGFGLNVG